MNLRNSKFEAVDFNDTVRISRSGYQHAGPGYMPWHYVLVQAYEVHILPYFPDHELLPLCNGAGYQETRKSGFESDILIIGCASR